MNKTFKHFMYHFIKYFQHDTVKHFEILNYQQSCSFISGSRYIFVIPQYSRLVYRWNRTFCALLVLATCQCKPAVQEPRFELILNTKSISLCLKIQRRSRKSGPNYDVLFRSILEKSEVCIGFLVLFKKFLTYMGITPYLIYVVLYRILQLKKGLL